MNLKANIEWTEQECFEALQVIRRMHDLKKCVSEVTIGNGSHIRNVDDFLNEARSLLLTKMAELREIALLDEKVSS